MKEWCIIINNSDYNNEIKNNSRLICSSLDNSKHVIEINALDKNSINDIFNSFTLYEINEIRKELSKNIEDWVDNEDFVNAVNSRN